MEHDLVDAPTRTPLVESIIIDSLAIFEPTLTDPAPADSGLANPIFATELIPTRVRPSSTTTDLNKEVGDWNFCNFYFFFF